MGLFDIQPDTVRPHREHTDGYYLYETVATLIAFMINSTSLFALGPRVDDYSEYILMLSNVMDMFCLTLNMIFKAGTHPTAEFNLTHDSFFDTVLEKHFTLIFLPVLLKLVILMIHVLMQSIFWFDIIRKQKFDGTTNVDELHQSQIWIEIKIKISLILLLQTSYPALLVLIPILIGSNYQLNVNQVGRMLNWSAPIIPILSAITMILAVPIFGTIFRFPFKCRKQIAPTPIEIMWTQSYASPI